MDSITSPQISRKSCLKRKSRSSGCTQAFTPAFTPAFTLVELLVVIGIIVVLISILLPALSKAREQANRAQCLSNQKQIVAAILMYAGDNKGTLPGPSGPCVVDPYTVNVISPAANSLLYTWGDTTNFWTNHMLSNVSLLQSYLGGVDGRSVWQCPSSVNIYNAPIAGTTISTFTGKIPGYGYMLNNSPNTDGGITYTNLPLPASNATLLQAETNEYFFGDWNAAPTSPAGAVTAYPTISPPKKITQIYALIGPSQATVGNANVVAESLGFIQDSSKIWLTCDLDGRNLGQDVSGTFAIVANGNTGQTTTVKNGVGYQPVHKTGGYYGRNYAFLDGHAEYLLMNDWPDACYQYP